MLCALFHFVHSIVVNTPGEFNSSSGGLLSADNPWQTHIRPDKTSDLILNNTDGYQMFANFNCEKKGTDVGILPLLHVMWWAAG